MRRITLCRVRFIERAMSSAANKVVRSVANILMGDALDVPRRIRKTLRSIQGLVLDFSSIQASVLETAGATAGLMPPQSPSGRDGYGVAGIVEPIAHVTNVTAGRAGYRELGTHLELRRSPSLVTDQRLNNKLIDAARTYRGELKGPGWDDLVKDKIILLNAYRPVRLPMPQDWLLVLENLGKDR